MVIVVLQTQNAVQQEFFQLAAAMSKSVAMAGVMIPTHKHAVMNPMFVPQDKNVATESVTTPTLTNVVALLEIKCPGQKDSAVMEKQKSASLHVVMTNVAACQEAVIKTMNAQELLGSKNQRLSTEIEGLYFSFSTL